MELKAVDLSLSVYELCTKEPELVPLLESIGFGDITKPGMLDTVGRFMTLEKGAKLKKISMEEITEQFNKFGYRLEKENRL